MKYLVQKLDGELLDAAVATALGGGFVAYGEHHSLHLADKTTNRRPAILNPGFVEYGGEVFEPSRNWAHGGPIIEREFIHLDVGIDSGERFWMGTCCARWEGTLVLIGKPKPGEKTLADLPKDGHGDGLTPLVAAMRAFVAHKLGNEVDL